MKTKTLICFERHLNVFRNITDDLLIDKNPNYTADLHLHTGAILMC